MKTIDNACLRGVSVLILSCALLSACGLKRKIGIGPPLPSVKSISVGADIDANLGNATRLDLVVVYSDAAKSTMPKTGPEWFRDRDALRSMLATDIDVVSLEVPAPSETFKVKLPKKARRKGLAVFAYANYAAPGGWPVVALTPFKRPNLQLQAAKIAVQDP
jgi:type VI secretion system protein